MARVVDVVRRCRATILTDWQAAAARAASARGLTQPEIGNIMPEFLDSLAKVQHSGALTTEMTRTVEGHVRTRLRQGFNLPEIVEEFALVGRCVSRAALEHDELHLDSVERESLFATLDAAAVLVAELYTRQMLDDEQTEKRYLREIRSLVSESERQGLPMGEHVRRVAPIIMEAIGGACVAIAVYDSKTRALIASGHAGALGEQLEVVARQSDDAVLASVEHATHLNEAVAGVEPWAVNHLRNLRATFVVRIESHAGLLGTIHVALEEQAQLATRQLSRLEVFGSWLTLHLDGAHLLDALNEQVALLQEERALRERFVAVLAHDLRQPLSSAKLAAHMLGSAQDQAKRDALLARLARNLDRSEHMVSDLLDANRVHAGQRLSISVRRCDLADVVRDVVDDLASAHGARFVRELDDDLVGFWSADIVRRALWNLGVNAVKYGAADTPITLRARRTKTGVRVSVHNFGEPIPAADLPRLFQTFFRTHASEASGRTGWGLGLALVLGCAEAHGGTVDVESSAERGTTFHIDLPLDARPFQHADVDAAAAAATT